MSRTITSAALALAAVATLALSACSGSSNASGNEVDSHTVRVGAAPIAHFYTARVAEEKGFFDEEGLDVELTDVTSASQQVALMESGTLDVGGSGPAELLTAAAQGMPVKILPFSDVSSIDPTKALRGIVIDPSKGITDVSQLKGQTLAVSNLLNAPHIDALGTLDKDGISKDDTTFVAIPSGQQWESLKSGEIQAAVMTDPSLTVALADGAKVLEYPEKSGNLLAFSWFVSDDFAKDRPEDAQAFLRAMDKAATLIEKDPTVLRDVAVEQGLDQSVADAMRIPAYQRTLTTEDLQPMADMLATYGVINQEIDPASVLTDLTGK